jgi:peptidoglycan/xylan/chitin deacetylase (PgdA/CDA1 family)
MKNQIPILMYHEVNQSQKIAELSKKTQYSNIMPVEQFESQMHLLSERGFSTCSFSTLLAWMRSRNQTPLPDKTLVLTFDDGYEGNFQYALPILLKYHFRATFFIIGDRVGQTAMMRWNNLRQLNDAGMSVQSHTMTHPLLGSLSPELIYKELSASKQILEDNLSASVEFISLPYGSYDQHFKQIALEVGYKGGCTSAFGFTSQESDPLLLERIIVKSTLNLQSFQRLVEQDEFYLARILRNYCIKQRIRRVIGEKLYNDIYNYFFSIEEEISK